MTALLKPIRQPKPRKFMRRSAMSTADRAWAIAVKLRDEYTCQRCGKYDIENHAHHVATRARRPDLKHDVANGATLCQSCHRWTHGHPLEATAVGLLATESYERGFLL